MQKRLTLFVKPCSNCVAKAGRKKRKFSCYLVPYWPERALIAECNGMLLKGTRLAIPQCLRKEVLKKLHDGHQGISRTRGLAKELIWWPRLGEKLARPLKECVTCAGFVTQNSEPLISTPTQSIAWKRVGVDLCFISNCHYLVLVDYLSRYWEVTLLLSTKRGAVIERLKSIFARHGIPETVVTIMDHSFLVPSSIGLHMIIALVTSLVVLGTLKLMGK